MKKLLLLICLLLTAVSCFTLVGCADNGGETPPPIQTQTIKLSKSSYIVMLGKTQNISLNYTGDKTLTYSSSDESVAIVDATGRCTALRKGVADITVTDGSDSAVCQITVYLGNKVPELEDASGVYEGAVIDFNSQPNAKPNILFNYQTYTDAEFEYVIDNPQVAEVVNDKIVPKTFGKAKITVTGKTWRNVDISNLSVSYNFTVADFDKQTSVSKADTTYYNTFGRVYGDDFSNTLDFPATAIEYIFSGTSFKADMKTSGATMLAVFLDSAKPVRITVTNKNAFEKITLFEGLENSAHKIRIVQDCEPTVSDGETATDGALQIKTVYADKFAKVSQKSDFKIEFIGDSITSGYQIVDNMPRSRNNSSASSTYAYILANKLNADYSVVAIRGATVKDNIPMTTTYNKTGNENSTAFVETDEPDVIVINLGTNDGNDTSKNYTRNSFKSVYAEFLAMIREKHPDAYIICTYGMMSVNQAILSGINDAIDETGDSKIVFVTPAPNDGKGGHPGATCHLQTANILYNYIVNTVLSK